MGAVGQNSGVARAALVWALERILFLLLQAAIVHIAVTSVSILTICWFSFSLRISYTFPPLIWIDMISNWTDMDGAGHCSNLRFLP